MITNVVITKLCLLQGIRVFGTTLGRRQECVVEGTCGGAAQLATLALGPGRVRVSAFV